ncbi:MAG TPA: S-layer homology domain-containing protein, partial [Thermoanaerobaculia bacterium]|nr:S-layer homology domain-containing protein [Thermoanaerobaculia bacterium]
GLALLTGGAGRLLGACGPFTDFTDPAFCPFVLEILTLGITTGTTATTFAPASPATRLQMAAFLSRTVDSVLRRGSRRAALDQFSSPTAVQSLAATTIGTAPYLLRSDGADVWVANNFSGSGGTVSRVRGSDGKLLETWTGATSAFGVLAAMGRVLVTGQTDPGNLYAIEPAKAAGAVTTVASSLGRFPTAIGFDGARIWVATLDGVSIVTPGASIPWTVTNVPGLLVASAAIYDGSNMWTTLNNAGKLVKLDAGGAILQTVTVGAGPEFAAFDGSNIWVPNSLSDSVSVVRASSGAVLATLTGNGIGGPFATAFDGQRVLVTGFSVSLSLWKAADLSPLGSVNIGASSYGVCSDGINFWITLSTTPGRLLRF